MAFDKTKPAASSTLRVSNPEILANFAALETTIDGDHDLSTPAAGHDKVTFNEQSGDQTTAANEMAIYTKDVGTAPGVYIRPESDGTVVQLTGIDGKVLSVSTDMLDQDAMDDDSATKTSSQQAIKAYVDASIAQVLTAKTTSYTVGADSSAAVECNGHYIFTNNGASGTVTFTLPAGAANYLVSFICQNATALRIQPNGNEVFIDFTHSSTATKYISTSTVGTMITIAWDGAKWQIMSMNGIWDEQT